MPEIADPEYVSAYINSEGGRKFIEANMARAIGQVNISASTMHKMPIPLPALPTQRRIMAQHKDRMTWVDRARAALEAQLAAIDALPAAFLRQAFAGDLR